jgi:nitroreductase
MDLVEAIRFRRSIRYFKPDPVPKEVMTKLIEIGRWSPSGSNTQPWELAVVAGEALDKVKTSINTHMKKTPAHPDIPYLPMPEPYRTRQKEFVRNVTAHQKAAAAGGINSKMKSKESPVESFFGAPAAIIVYTDPEICPRSFFGLGMIAQTLALAALDLGLGTCIMGMVTNWPEVYRENNIVPEHKLIAFALAVGYPDTEASINNFDRTREPLENFVHWFGFDS